MLLKDREGERHEMVERQIAGRGVKDSRLLAAMRRVPRHAFVAEADAGRAYTDQALPIGEGQTISQPYMVAVMTAALGLSPDARVLEIGTGSGYQAAILGELAREVVSIERRADLAGAARARLAALGYSGVRVVVGDGTLGYPQGAPYDGILVTAGAPAVPAPLKAQLAEGGRLVIPVGPPERQEMVVVRRRGEQFTESIQESCVFVPLIGEHGWRRV